MSAKIAGGCPMGCGPTLFLANSGNVMCSRLECPRPTAVSEILDDRETEHLVTFDLSGFVVKHPLRERLDDALMACQLHDFIAGLDGQPIEPGLYRAVEDGDSWVWSPVATGGAQ